MGVRTEAMLTYSSINCGIFCYRLQTEWSECHSIPVSAKTECTLQNLAKENVIQYKPGDSDFTVSYIEGCDAAYCDKIKSAKVILSR